MVKQVYLTHNRALLSATSLGQSGPRSNSNERVLYNTQNSKAGASPSDGLKSYTRPLFGGSYHSAEMQLVYSTTPVIWA